MKNQRKVYNLYSDHKNTVILSMCRDILNGKYYGRNNNHVEIFSVIDGSGILEFKDGTRVSMGKGDTFILDRMRGYTFTSNGNVEYTSLSFNYSDFIDGQFKIMTKSVIHDFMDTLAAINDKINGIHITAQRIQEMIYLIERELQNKQLYSDYVIKSYIVVIYTLSMQYYLGEPAGSNVGTLSHLRDIEKSIAYINDNISDKISLDTLAKIATMGKTNYSVIFKKITGMTVWEYILNARIELATTYLVENNTDFNMTELAFKCGFNNSAHFNKTFKKIKGMTPSDYKRDTENPCF